MSFTIPQNFVDTFSANVHMLSAQNMSRLIKTVDMEPTSGEGQAHERMGVGEDLPNTVETRHGDTPLNEIPHTRRWTFPSTYDYATLVDRPDKVKLLIDPKSGYTIRHAGAMARQMDDTIISALGGSAPQGKTGTESSVALPSAQKIAVGGTGLTVEKLRQAKVILDAADVPDGVTRWLIYNPTNMDDLLGDDRVTSQDFNVIKALVRGEVDTFLGFKFVLSNRLSVDGSGDRLCYAYLGNAVKFAANAMPQTTSAERPDKRHAHQLYTWGEWDAVRIEDELVVEIACAEA